MNINLHLNNHPSFTVPVARCFEYIGYTWCVHHSLYPHTKPPEINKKYYNCSELISGLAALPTPEKTIKAAIESTKKILDTAISLKGLPAIKSLIMDAQNKAKK